MGSSHGKTIVARRKIDECTSNSSLSNLRYVMASNKSKWKMFRKKGVPPIPAYTATSLKPAKGCPCGTNGPCRQKVTPKGVTIHYPQKKKKKLFGNKTYVVQKCEKGNANKRPNVKTIPQRKRPIWGLDKIHCRPVILTPRPYQPVCVD
ncbi:uncharacterized protein LOC126976684 [Leptidea sinapis]|uniref:uncharacterized protein LOC126976684 n=1 Tax=Leptidea sinapis TaxID=189913 RepID=UPI002133A073|nr:uncharacterized protein LOC126976684 [Leptidea sinapis]